MERSTIVRVHEGLHARPATRFVKLAKSFECDIEIAKDGKSVSAKSSVKLMLLGVKENDAVTVRAEGADAIEALEVLIGYLENPRAGIEESEPAAPARRPAQAGPAPDPAAPAPGQIKGVAASEGLALGPAFPFFPAEIRPGTGKLAPDAVEPEIARYEAAVAAVQERMAHSLAHGSLAESDRGIIAALKDIASDETLRDETLALVRGGLDAVSAVLGAASTVAQQFAGLDDPYMNARADDVHAISRQICLTLLGQEDPDLETLPEGAILIAEDIGAWDLARAPLKRIRGVICGHGGSTSHVAIIARTSSTSDTMGSMTLRLPCTAARSSARNCGLKISGRSRHMRTPRQPRKGFSSWGKSMPLTGLSPPMSSVRTITAWDGKALSRAE